jgi:hypothetical protein
MAEYDFKQLSSYDFEILVRDLLQEELGVTLESFKLGKDNGIDLRYIKDKSHAIIIQCKHYANSSFSTLKKAIKKERTKLNKLKFSRYILVTSIGLTPQNKDTLMSILKPYCKTTGDILGKDEVNNLISRFGNIEKKHYKLWLTSTNILEKIIHSDIYSKSRMELDAIINNRKYYVQNKGFDRAKKILKQQNYCIIAGIPGIGKTTLAGMLALYYIDKGFEFYKIVNSIEEAFKVYEPHKKQFFYYDDFLGQTTFQEKLSKNEDAQLLRFIEIISKNKNSKLVMTTREYILNQSKLTYEKLANSNFDINKCILKLDDYSRLDKARILYNHLYFSNIGKKQKKEMVFDKRYLKIIDHRNYNPRLIEWMTVKYSLNNPTGKSYFNLFLDLLDNPEKLWHHIYEYQLHYYSKNLLLVLTSLPDKVLISQLKSVFLNYHIAQSNLHKKPIENNDFSNALKELEGTFITSHKSEYYNSVLISFGNPSIRDFMENIIRNNPDTYCEILKSATFFCQIVKLDSFLNTEIIGTNLVLYINHIKDTIERCFDSKDFPGEYMMSLSERLVFTINLFLKLGHRDDNFINNLFNKVTSNLRFCDLEDYFKLLGKMEELNLTHILNEEVLNVISFIILSHDYDEELDDYKIVKIFYEKYPALLSHGDLDYIRQKFKDFYKDSISTFINDAEYAEQLEEYKDLLKDVSKFFSVKLYTEIDILESRIRELKNMENSAEDDYDEDFYRDSFYESRVEERMISEMFDTILDS